MTHFSQQDNFSVAARVLGALFYYAPESAEAAPLVAVLTSDGWETQWPLPEASLAPLVTAFQTQCEETHAQAWQRLFVGPWALPSPPWGSGWIANLCCLAIQHWHFVSGCARKAFSLK
ncbi:anaerobic dimethyl sulfoxide reductase maturation protein (twin-arginine leader-binding protein) [Escherichia coli]|uniref:Anaerobic dimethyl sulfoxide reductase maturation protein (Twin-arginine leader-binding protein) n=1 Tax=Escherichia coli TaxID=562 RepID=A0A377BM22_ECOLX|nr:anaerobic dimethyl sulfoxide reductase maturation protein (twin-arginine leader-binding protein) [Escherichia coli]